MANTKYELRSTVTNIEKLYLITVLLIAVLLIISIFQVIPFLHPTIAIVISVLLIVGFVKITNSPWEMLGLRKRDLLYKSVFSALGLAFLIALTFFFFLIPLIESITNSLLDYSLFEELTKDTKTTLAIIPVVWVTAAFFEEFIFRGFFIAYNFHLFKSRTFLFLSIIFSSILFGFAHSYQGITGIIVTALVGLVLSVILLKKSCNLFFLIMIHGFIDTIYILIFYFNFDTFHIF